MEIERHPKDLPALRECLIRFKDHGMGQDSMLKNLERLRGGSNPEMVDVLLELMDLVTGWCSPELSVFDQAAD